MVTLVLDMDKVTTLGSVVTLVLDSIPKVTTLGSVVTLELG